MDPIGVLIGLAMGAVCSIPVSVLLVALLSRYRLERKP